MSATPELKPQTAPAAEAAPSLRSRAREVPAGEGIQLTEAAAGQIKDIIAKGGYPGTMYLFVGVKGGGCSGFQYVLDLRDEAQAPVAEMDEVFLSQDLVIVSDFKSYMIGNLSGTTIDYKTTMMESGFTFNNPNAKHTCGCGSSYSA